MVVKIWLIKIWANSGRHFRRYEFLKIPNCSPLPKIRRVFFHDAVGPRRNQIHRFTRRRLLFPKTIIVNHGPLCVHNMCIHISSRKQTGRFRPCGILLHLWRMCRLHAPTHAPTRGFRQDVLSKKILFLLWARTCTICICACT